MTVVIEDLDLPGGSAPLAEVQISLAGVDCNPIHGFTGMNQTIIGALRFKPGNGIGPNGVWTADLVPNDVIVPAGTAYRIVRRTSDGQRAVSCIQVPVTGGPYGVSELLVDPPGAITSAALTVHALQPVDEGVHGVVIHDWDVDDWIKFTQVVMTQDGAQDFDEAIVAGRGRVTGPDPPGGSQRVAYLRDGTRWVDSVITSVIWGPSTDWAGNNAQQGHIHRVREVSPGVWEGIAIWTSVVFGGDYRTIHAAGVRFDGTTLSQSDGPVANANDAEFIDRTVRVTGQRRFTFGSVFQEYTTLIPDLWGLRVNDIVSVTDDPDASFNETDVVIQNADRVNGIIQVVDPAAGAAAPYAAVENGLIRPSAGYAQKRWTPFHMSTRVIGGSPSTVDVEFKRWRYNEAEPDWGSLQTQRRTLTANAAVPELAVDVGHCALWNAHYFNGSFGEWGRCRFERAVT